MEDPWNDLKWKDAVDRLPRRRVRHEALLRQAPRRQLAPKPLHRPRLHRPHRVLPPPPEVSDARFRSLPVLEDFPVDAVPKSPRPNDSPLYNSIRERVRKELFPQEGKAMHRTGGDRAAATILGFAAFAYTLYFNMPGIVAGSVLGLAGRGSG